ncbi:MAG: hypothetical protein JNL14_05270 [Devosia sp.]|uniref:hypothetical protein n=1 Tax=Devosia sp. TaxID=1871048 RepID=UPI001A4D7760|nr:hypothetical protein [Devosia sp.]MBL8597128.1 hypothetical protein [Devosia sp.]
MTIRALAFAVFATICVPAPTTACDMIPPSRMMTLEEKVAGLEKIFGGTVIGYVMSDGTSLRGPLPAQCLDGDGRFDWWDQNLGPECAIYLETSAALFRVDVPIVGPSLNDIASYGMTWGDGDCNIDFEVGEKWLVAGSWFTQELTAPIRENEIAILKRLAARPPFDVKTLYR